MAIIQTTDQVRYLRRKNLDEEARIIGNYYSDAISMYGIDCIYHKMDMSEFNDFKGTIDQNTILKRAYGYDITPNYLVQADTVAFAEVDSDIFNINKIGYVPNTDITLVFDTVRFACDLAPKLGRYREYKITPDEVTFELPEFDPTLSSSQFPYEIDLDYSVDIPHNSSMHGYMRCIISSYSVGESQTVMCDPYEHTDFKVCFPKNEDLYYSLKNTIQNDDYLETLLFMTFTVEKMKTGEDTYKYVLYGKTGGSVLFFDLDQLGKYTSMIHPEIGDIVEIDFPDENNREKYEITDCFDKQLTQDGINPLLHKYVWKCKARRYINSHEELAPETNEADKRLEEKRNYDAMVQEEVAEEVSDYDYIDEERGSKQDAAYGGYDGIVENYDKQETALNHVRYDFIEGGQCLDILRFGCGSRLVTDGYQLIFVRSDGEAYVIAQSQQQPTVNKCTFECRTRWLKATDSAVVFVNVEGESCFLANDNPIADGSLEIALDDLHQSTVEPGQSINRNYDNFIKFDGTRTVMFATGSELYVKLASGKIYQLI